MFVFAVVLAAARLAAANAFGEAFTLRDSLLPGHDYKTIKGGGWLDCLRNCTSETRCLSYNFFQATNEQENICEMNDRAMDNSCDTKGHLISFPGWFYNQVKKNVKVDRPGSPGKNRKSKHYKSCKEAYDAGERDDRAYELELDYEKTRVYCHMSPIPGCGSRGYTLVMKINGSAPTFLYDSTLWTNRTAYNVPGGSSLASEETKLPTYWETPFSQICLGMTVAGQTNYLAINYTADSLYSLIADGQYRNTTLGRDAWKALITNSSLQENCNKEGFNALPGDPGAARARIGITSNNENNCSSNDSRLGFGTSGRGDLNDSCGNSAYHGGDNGDKKITAFGFIFV